MTNDLKKAQKAELMQAVKALYIPLVLFLSTIVFALGVFLVYNEYAIGWACIALCVAMATSAFVALFKFQNSYRAKGIIPKDEDA